MANLTWTGLALSGVLAGMACGPAESLEAASLPDNLVAEGVPEIPAALVEEVRPYLELRSAYFRGWYPQRLEMLIGTRLGDVSQLHRVRIPGGARQQITFFSEPVRGGIFQPGEGCYIVFSKVRGLSGYGKSFLLRDNGMKREDSVRDIGVILEWLRADTETS